VSVPLYFDVHVPSAIADELRLRGVDVLRAQDDGAAELEDSDLLDRATRHGRLLFTQDRDFLREATRRFRTGEEVLFGIVFAHQMNISIGECIIDLEIIAKNSDPVDWYNRVEHLPL
jgi:predicted nuclease of predicted toxin-antitoxin system